MIWAATKRTPVSLSSIKMYLFGIYFAPVEEVDYLEYVLTNSYII